MSYLIDIKMSFPKNYYSQGEIIDLMSSIWPDKKKRIDQFHNNVCVEKRHLALNLEEYKTLGHFGDRSLQWKEHTTNLLEEAISNLIAEHNLDPQIFDAIAFTSITGISIPSVDALLMNKFEFKRNIKRMPYFGLGCLGGVAGINRVHDYLKGHPEQCVLFIASELCSLTFQFDDKSVANLVSTGLFADGASAVLMCGKDHPFAKKAKLEIVDNISNFYPNTERTMGWDLTENGFKIVLSGDVAEIIKKNIPEDISYFLDKNMLKNSEVDHIISHPGGPKVLEALSEASGYSKEKFKHSWESLKDLGNMSSVSVLDIFRRTIEASVKKDETCLALAMGPAFNSEATLLKGI
ncbi:MAG: type III polyketide synthase [Oligoflexia bacterium]|nr:type III polyketide synthase [Oligoflexia bacterium]